MQPKLVDRCLKHEYVKTRTFFFLSLYRDDGNDGNDGMSDEDDLTDNISDSTSRTGKKGVKWTKQEDNLLKQMVEQYGEKWELIASEFKDRLDIQCQQRWTKVVNPDLIKGPWTKEVRKYHSKQLLRSIRLHHLIFVLFHFHVYSGR